MDNQCIIFVSSRKMCKVLYKFYKMFFNCTYVYSDLEERNKNIYDFKNKKYKYIFSTTVLERGITIKDVDVIIYNTRDNAFDKSSIIQMTGRVGRSIKNPYGHAYILTTIKTKDINMALDEIKEANDFYEMSVLRKKDRQVQSL